MIATVLPLHRDLADYPGATLTLGRFLLIWVAVTAVCAAQMTAPGTSAAQTRSPTQGETVSVEDLGSKGRLSKQQILADIVALAKARRDADSLTALGEVMGGKPVGVVPGDEDVALNGRAAMALVLELENELQKVMTRADINSAVRSWNQLSFPAAKLKTTADFQDAMKKPSKRSDAIRTLADMIERATNEKEMADFHRFLSAVEAAPPGSTDLVDFLLHAQRSDALTGACASVILSQVSLSAAQGEQMMQGLSKQRITTSSDPVIQHLVDLASQFVSTSEPRVKSIRH